MIKMDCPYFSKCGGCTSMHIPYEEQLIEKKKILARQLMVKEEFIKVFSDSFEGYRNRMDYVFHKSGLGFRKKNDWKTIVDINNCAIANSEINKLTKEIKDFFFKDKKEQEEFDSFDIHKKTGTFKYAVIRTPENNSSISFVLNKESSRVNEAIEKIKLFAKITTATNILVTYVHSNQDVSNSNDFIVIKGEEFLEQVYLGKKFKFSIQGFFQNNTVMAKKMLEQVKKIISSYDDKNKIQLLDLYGGVGTFGIVNSDEFQKTTIVELAEDSILAAKKNIKLNNLENVEAIVLDAKLLRKVKLDSPLFVITDPPRAGMDSKTIRQLNSLKPEVIIYISCNPNQLSKDIPKLFDYELKSASLFDLFPQTPHMEAVVELVKKKNEE